MPHCIYIDRKGSGPSLSIRHLAIEFFGRVQIGFTANPSLLKGIDVTTGAQLVCKKTRESGYEEYKGEIRKPTMAKFIGSLLDTEKARLDL